MDIVFATIVICTLIILSICGIIAFKQPKKSEGDIISWKEYKEKTKKP